MILNIGNEYKYTGSGEKATQMMEKNFSILHTKCSRHDIYSCNTSKVGVKHQSINHIRVDYHSGLYPFGFLLNYFTFQLFDFVRTQ